MSCLGRATGIALGLTQMLSVVSLHAQPAPPAEAPPSGGESATEEPEADAQPEDENTARGLRLYRKGVQLAKNEQWGEALAAFEEAATARNAPLVRYNIAYCQRALGRYVAARRTAQRLVAEPDGLAESSLANLRAYLSELDELVVKLDVTMIPRGANLTVDGRPLEKEGEVYLAGVASGREGTKPSQARFTILLDPGSHLFRAQRRGHQDVVVQHSYRPGQTKKLDLRLDVMPATVVVKSEPADAIVRVDEREVGVAPVEFERPAGSYRLEVIKDDYTTYQAALDLDAGQRAELTAELQPYEPPLYLRWWFWASVGGAIATGVVTAVVFTRPEPETPPYDAGRSGWLVDPQPAGLTFARF